MISITTDHGETNVKMSGIGLFVLGDAGVIVTALYDSFAKKKGKGVADHFAECVIAMLQNRMEGKDIDGSPLKQDEHEEAKPKPEKKDETNLPIEIIERTKAPLAAMVAECKEGKKEE